MPQFRASHTDDSRVTIYDHNMFIIQATDVNVLKCIFFDTDNGTKILEYLSLSNLILAPKILFILCDVTTSWDWNSIAMNLIYEVH